MKYDPDHTYELRPLGTGNQPPIYGVPAPPSQQAVVTKSKADRLREAKKLLDEKILTEAEYETEKKKILDSNDQ